MKYFCTGSYWVVLSKTDRVCLGYEHTPQFYRTRHRARSAAKRLKEVGIQCSVSRAEVTITDK